MITMNPELFIQPESRVNEICHPGMTAMKTQDDITSITICKCYLSSVRQSFQCQSDAIDSNFVVSDDRKDDCAAIHDWQDDGLKQDGNVVQLMNSAMILTFLWCNLWSQQWSGLFGARLSFQPRVEFKAAISVDSVKSVICCHPTQWISSTVITCRRRWCRCWQSTIVIRQDKRNYWTNRTNHCHLVLNTDLVKPNNFGILVTCSVVNMFELPM